MRALNPWLAVGLVAALLAPVGSSAQQAWAPRHAHGERAVGPRTLDPAALPAGVRLIRDVRYGDDSLETFDVYVPAHANAAPVIFMAHGGGWRRGHKAARNVVEAKVAHWVPRGFILVSVDYPMLPGTPPLQQARDVALALATAQREAGQWGGDAGSFVLMGHSAGAHLVSLISAEPSLAISQGALPWLGTVALDSAAFDVSRIMQARHLRLYDQAFGSDPATWAAASPALQVSAKIAPFLAVCSSRRANSCGQARGFARKAGGFGSRVEVLPEDLSHGEINAQLGVPSEYTARVDAFLASLGPSLAARLH